MYDAELNQYVKDVKSLKVTIVTLYNITWDQCSALMQNRLESLDDYDDMRKDHDIATLLKSIRMISNELQVSANVYDALDEAKRRFFTYV